MSGGLFIHANKGMWPGTITDLKYRYMNVFWSKIHFLYFQSNRQPVKLNLLTCQVKPSAEDRKCFDLISRKFYTNIPEKLIYTQVSMALCTTDCFTKKTGTITCLLNYKMQTQGFACLTPHSLFPADNRTYHFQAEDEQEFVAWVFRRTFCSKEK